MTHHVPLPHPEAVQKLLSELIGQAISVQEGSAPAGRQAMAAYESDDGQLLAACLFDLRLAATLGASLVMLPASAAKEAETASGLEAGIASNFQEVANVATSLFSRDGKHARLREVAFVLLASQADVTDLLARHEARLNLEVAVPGYDKGCMSILMP